MLLLLLLLLLLQLLLLLLLLLLLSQKASTRCTAGFAAWFKPALLTLASAFSSGNQEGPGGHVQRNCGLNYPLIVVVVVGLIRLVVVLSSA